VVGGDPPPLGLHGRRQLVEHLERLGPVALGLVDGYQLIERRVPVLARSRQLLEDTLGPVHESRALIVERQSERGLVAQAWPDEDERQSEEQWGQLEHTPTISGPRGKR